MALHGLILFAHGARDARWSAPFEAVVERVRAQRPDAQLRLAYLELMTPDLPGAADELVALGCTTIQVLPLFLGTGGHLRRDLPALIERVRQRYPDVGFTLQPAAGEHERVTSAMASIAVDLLTP